MRPRTSRGDRVILRGKVGVIEMDGPVWSYEGNRGPACWGALDEAFSACADGAEQSPIDLATGAAEGDYPAVAFDYGPRAGTVVNTGRTVQVNVDRGSGIMVGGTRYELLQFHFHHASEHTVVGARFPMELHLVHRSDAGDVAVVGVLLRDGAANETLAPIWAHLPREAGSTAAVPGMVRVAELLPETRTAWRYRGSLTTPPCTEGVSWIVMTEPVTLSAAQIAAFGALYPRNYRPLQPLGRRILGRDKGGRDE